MQLAVDLSGDVGRLNQMQLTSGLPEVNSANSQKQRRTMHTAGKDAVEQQNAGLVTVVLVAFADGVVVVDVLAELVLVPGKAPPSLIPLLTIDCLTELLLSSLTENSNVHHFED